jgi:hypothetical protein
LTGNQAHSSLRYDPGNRRVTGEAFSYSRLVTWTSFVIWVLAFELYLLFASLCQSAGPRLAKTKGNPTKRIVRILTTECAVGSRVTHEKELLMSGKNSSFYKTNHPGLLHALPHHDPNNSISCLHAWNEIMVQSPLLLFANWNLRQSRFVIATMTQWWRSCLPSMVSRVEVPSAARPGLKTRLLAIPLRPRGGGSI